MSVYNYNKVVEHINVTNINTSEIDVSLALNITLPNMGSSVAHKWQPFIQNGVDEN